MLEQIRRQKWNILAIAAIWLAFECWISWAAFCDQIQEGGGNPGAYEENSCIFRGPITSVVRAVIGWWRHTFDEADSYIALFTSILAISTIALWFATKGLFAATKETAEAAKKSADAAIDLERPRLFIGSIKCESGVMIEPGIETVLCRYTIENYGKTPALLEWSCVDLRCLQGLPDIPPYRNLRSWRDQVIYQQQMTEELTTRLPDTDIPALDNPLAGNELFLFGYFTFEDVFKTRRKTGFCYRINPSEGAFLRMRLPTYDYDIEEEG